MSFPVSSADVAHLLAPYPHVASCGRCQEYAEEYLGEYPSLQVLAAVLDHHDSAHGNDRLGWEGVNF